jgi:hypothetical protein
MAKTTQPPTRPESARAAEREATSRPPDRRPPGDRAVDRPDVPLDGGRQRDRAGEAAPAGTGRVAVPPGLAGDRARETAPAATGVETVPPALPGPRLFGARVRGRHRRPRPRKVLFAVGGLALAAGALSVVRMVPGPGSGVPGTAGAEPREDVGGGVSDGATNAAGTLPAALGVSPSATSVMGGVSATPTAGPSLASGPATSAATPAPEASATPGTPDPPDMTTIPEAPNTPAPSTAAPRPPATTPAAPHPGRSTSPSSPAPQPGEPGLCVPVVGLCVGPLGH